MGYFPSVAAHSALQPPNIVQDNSELSRLRKLVGEYEVLNQDLSTRLIKAKKNEEQHVRDLARYAEKFQLSNIPKGHESDAAVIPHARFEPTTHPAVLASQVQDPEPANPTSQKMNPPDQVIDYPQQTISPHCDNGNPLEPEATPMSQQRHEQDIQRIYQQQIQPYWYANEAQYPDLPEAHEPNTSTTTQLRLGPNTQSAIPAMHTQNPRLANPTYQTTYTYDSSGNLVSQQQESSQQQHIQILNQQNHYYGHADGTRSYETPASGDRHLDPKSQPSAPTPHTLTPYELVERFQQSRREYLMRQSQTQGYGFVRQSSQTGWEHGPRWL